MRVLKCLAMFVAATMIAGCQESSTDDVSQSKAGVTTTKVSALTADICGKCGCCADCQDCCSEDAEKCSCGFNKGSDLCCVKGLSPREGKYCKSCGHVKGTDSCCADDNVGCSQCGLAKGSPLCCKIGSETSSNSGEPDGHGEHAAGDHESEKEHGEHGRGEHGSGEHDSNSGEHRGNEEHANGDHDSSEHGEKAEHAEGAGG